MTKLNKLWSISSLTFQQYLTLSTTLPGNTLHPCNLELPTILIFCISLFWSPTPFFLLFFTLLSLAKDLSILVISLGNQVLGLIFFLWLVHFLCHLSLHFISFYLFWVCLPLFVESYQFCLSLQRTKFWL